MITKKNLSALRLKFIFWFVFVGTASVTPFIGLYYKNVLRAPDGAPFIELIGVLLFVNPLFSLLSNPLIGILSDKFKIKDKLLFTCSVFLVVGAVFTVLPGFSSFYPGNLFLRFGFLALGVLFIGFFQSPIIPLLNTETLDFLHNNNLDRRNYGNYRVVGTLSWIVVTFIMGIVLHLFNDMIITLFFYAGGFCVVAFLAIKGMKAKLKPVKLPWHLLKGDRYFQKFLVFVFLQSMGLFSSFNFTSYFMDDLNVGLFFIGLSFAVAAFLEVPVMLKSRQIIHKFGYRKMIMAGTVILIIKLFLLFIFAPLRIAWLMVLAMSVHGLGFGLQNNGMIELIAEQAHKDLRATYMNLFNMVRMIAIAFGNLLNTYIIKFFDSTWMIFVNALVVSIAIFYFFLFVREKNFAERGG
ncbi:MAG: MFS transporter [Spirochaetales bacterium]|nr:MFS transporter [Spirochaetales bacterium]